MMHWFHLSSGADFMVHEPQARLLLTVLMPNRLIRKRTYANCSSFHLRVFLGLSNPQGQRQTSILPIPHDNLRKQK
jgi:hypothetical protein